MSDKPTFRKRVSAALDAWRNGSTTINPWREFDSQKGAPFVMWPDYRNETPAWKLIDVEAFIEEGFNNNAIIYAALMYKAFASATPPLVAYAGDAERPEVLPLSANLARLCKRPNKSQGWREFQMLQTIYLSIAGDAYTYIERKGNRIDALYPLNPARTFIVPHKERDKGTLGYVYINEGQALRDGTPILPDDIIHTKMPHPNDRFGGDGYGLSQIMPAARSADVDQAITRFIQIFFQRGAVMPGLLKFDKPMNRETVQEVKERWMQIYGGYENWTDIGVLDQGGTYQQISPDFDKMGFNALDNRNVSRILMAIGVPPILVGSQLGLENATYSNYELARDAFWQDRMLPELRLFEDDWQYYLSDGNAWPAYDLSKVPALADDGIKIAEQVGEAFSRGAASANDYRAALGLDPYDVDYKIVALSSMIVPVGGDAPAPEAQQVQNDEDNRKSAQHTKEHKWSAEQKARMYKAVDNIAVSWESKYRSAAAKAFRYDLENILAILTETEKAARRNKATIVWERFYDAIKEYLQTNGAENWRALFLPLIRGTVTAQGKSWASILGMQFDTQNLEARDWYNNYMLEFAQPINETTLKEIATILNQAQAEGWSVPEMQKHLTTLFDQYISGNLSAEDFAWYANRLPPHRTELIARTETIRASNAGSMEVFTAWGVQMKEWLTTLDGRERETHRELDGQIKAINQSFVVPSNGVSLRFPGDPFAPIGETANCRCTVLPIMPGDQLRLTGGLAG